MKQLDLSDAANVHRDDPSTSHRALASSRKSRAAHRQAVFDRLSLVPRTSTWIASELEAHTAFALDRYQRLCQVRKRLSDLRRDGLAERIDSKGRESAWIRSET